MGLRVVTLHSLMMLQSNHTNLYILTAEVIILKAYLSFTSTYLTTQYLYAHHHVFS